MRTARLNDTTMGNLPTTLEERDELSQWLVELNVYLHGGRGNGSNDGQMSEPPAWYKPFIAWQQLAIMGAIDADLYPWSVPGEWIELLSAIWLASLQANKLLQGRGGGAVTRSTARKRSKQETPPYGIVDSRGGSA